MSGVVVGLGCSTAADPAEVPGLLAAALADAGRAAADVVAVATIDRRADHPATLALGLPVRAFPAERLATVAVPTPSAVVERAVGTASVAEAAALLAAGPGAALLAPKRAGRTVTVALAEAAP